MKQESRLYREFVAALNAQVSDDEDFRDQILEGYSSLTVEQLLAFSAIHDLAAIFSNVLARTRPAHTIDFVELKFRGGECFLRTGSPAENLVKDLCAKSPSSMAKMFSLFDSGCKDPEVRDFLFEFAIRENNQGPSRLGRTA